MIKYISVNNLPKKLSKHYTEFVEINNISYNSEIEYNFPVKTISCQYCYIIYYYYYYIISPYSNRVIWKRDSDLLMVKKY